MRSTLDAVPEGKTVRVVEIYAGPGATVRLRELGIKEGSLVKVVKNSGIGPIVIETSEGRFALGRGMASRVIVEEAF
ncbi:FeoA family protein [Ignicoccus islandicus DSM 13165]|uniref:FeoA family protein n=1 Tax=Ignicoccus islandicus DSM 13165 TaxID=940295 RepID=A0A0U2WLL3_9CREN|nr:FeoA domain-containing protein [Ignicoccus islandicus]ALU11809.1 FeoA family protein [Ignicoccus islandicus DSM 13165]